MTSQFALNIYAASLCDEAMEFEKMEKEIKDLRDQISSNKPVCPICQKQMRQINYQGYYDSFSYWSCGCEKFENPDEKASGAYA